MHETIGQMSSRISLLETAIEKMQSLVSTEPHPLLQGGDVQAMHPIVSTQPKKPPTTSEEDVVKALGAFSIGDKGETTFHEASATSEASLLPYTHIEVFLTVIRAGIVPFDCPFMNQYLPSTCTDIDPAEP